MAEGDNNSTPAKGTARNRAKATPAKGTPAKGTTARTSRTPAKASPAKTPAKKAPAKATPPADPTVPSATSADPTAPDAPAAESATGTAAPEETTASGDAPADTAAAATDKETSAVDTPETPEETPGKAAPTKTAKAAKTPPAKAAKSAPAKSGPAKRPPAKSTARSTPSKSRPAGGKGGRRPPAVVAARRSLPWGMIAATTAVVLFAVAVIGYAVIKVQRSKPIDPAKGITDAASIPGIFHETIPAREHTTDNVKYNRTPPIGGNHDATWADCSGTVYSQPIRDENAVHTMEHGAVWITYQPTLAAGDVDKLKGVVDGKNYTLMSPYPGLKTPVSLQAWGYQLYLNSVDMGTINRFLKDLRDNANNAPEPHGVCANPDFKVSPLAPDPATTGAATPSASVSTKPSGSSSATPTKP